MEQIFTILVVDSDLNILKECSNLLDESYNLQIATDRASTFNIARIHQPDLIFLDVNMPDFNSFEALKEMHQDELVKNIPIIFLTSTDEKDFLKTTIDAGGVDYITKPIDAQTFLLKIKLWTRVVANTSEKLQLLDQYKKTVDRGAIVSKTDKFGCITYANDKFCELSGYSREELIGKSHNIVRHPDMQKETFKELWKTIESGKPWFGVVKNLSKDKELYIVDTVINPILDKFGNIIEYIGVRNDITELETYKELLKDELSSTNKSLKESINYMTQYEDAINSITAVVKTDTQNIITYANEKFCELMAYDLVDLIGKSSEDLRANSHKNSNDCQKIQEELKNKKSTTKLLTNFTKNGEKLYTITLFYPILDLDGNVIEHLQVMHDVTDIVNLNKEIADTQKEVIFTMAAIGETRSKETGQHVKRVAEYSCLLAKLSGIEVERAELIKQASPMHDIGKVGIPDSILNKPGKLTSDEYEIMKTHTSLGYEMLKHSKREILQTAATIANTHHEKWDGSGYPNKLSGENIPIEGRVTAVADIFDALGHDRVYKKAWELERILKLFEEEKGKHFDPHLIDTFISNLDEFLKLRDEFKDEAQ